jgi:hypothetical protein
MESNPILPGGDTDRMSILNRIKDATGQLRRNKMVELRKRSPLHNANGKRKFRGLDGTMFGPFRSSSRWISVD